MSAPPAHERIVYCLTRDHDLAADIEGRLQGAIAFFYNDAARLHQAVVLRRPQVVVIDTGAIREEYGDAGLGPIIGFLRDRAPDARVAVRPTIGAEWLIAAEAGPGATMLPSDRDACLAALAEFCLAPPSPDA
jgi:hypothetical protein